MFNNGNRRGKKKKESGNHFPWQLWNETRIVPNIDGERTYIYYIDWHRLVLKIVENAFKYSIILENANICALKRYFSSTCIIYYLFMLILKCWWMESALSKSSFVRNRWYMFVCSNSNSHQSILFTNIFWRFFFDFFFNLTKLINFEPSIPMPSQNKW